MTRAGTLAGRLERLGSFAAALESPDFVAGEYVTPEAAPGTWTMSYVRYHSEVDRFHDLAYEDGWVRTDVNWGDWNETPEALSLRDEPAALASATADQLAKLITVLVRQERFVEGSLKGAFDSGLVLGIVRRAGVLARRTDG
jgi:hypothetical protein